MDPSQLKVVNYPEAVLRQRAEPVESVDEQVRLVAKRMIELMHEHRGVGLAAPQVGLSLRMFVCCPTGEPEDEQVFINPMISEPTKEMAWLEEGCLSLPEIRGEINRPVGVTIEALDEFGEKFVMQSDDFPARVWQHEFDHLEGILIIDKMKMVDRMANRRMIKELEAMVK